ncbi:MAG: hypothetical protein Kow0022_09530 [Phycisphaerales bacterium]
MPDDPAPKRSFGWTGGTGLGESKAMVAFCSGVHMHIQPATNGAAIDTETPTSTESRKKTSNRMIEAPNADVVLGGRLADEVLVPTRVLVNDPGDKLGQP